MNGDLQPPRDDRHRDFQPQTIAKLKPEEFTEHSYCLCKEKGIYIQQNPTGHGSMTRHQEVDSLMAISKLNGNIMSSVSMFFWDSKCHEDH
jgi:hypothetical protein